MGVLRLPQVVRIIAQTLRNLLAFLRPAAQEAPLDLGELKKELDLNRIFQETGRCPECAGKLRERTGNDTNAILECRECGMQMHVAYGCCGYTVTECAYPDGERA